MLIKVWKLEKLTFYGMLWYACGSGIKAARTQEVLYFSKSMFGKW